MVGVLIIIFIALFSNFGAAFLSNRMIDLYGNRYCETFTSCFVDMLWVTTSFGYYLPEWIDMRNVEEVIFIILFWIVVPTILMNVLLAVVVDALGDMRA